MFAWNELVAIGLIKELKDPELVRYFISILKPLRRDMVEEEAREWHQSLYVGQPRSGAEWRAASRCCMIFTAAAGSW